MMGTTEEYTLVLPDLDSQQYGVFKKDLDNLDKLNESELRLSETKKRLRKWLISGCIIISVLFAVSSLWVKIAFPERIIENAKSQARQEAGQILQATEIEKQAKEKIALELNTRIEILTKQNQELKNSFIPSSRISVPSSDSPVNDQVLINLLPLELAIRGLLEVERWDNRNIYVCEAESIQNLIIAVNSTLRQIWELEIKNGVNARLNSVLEALKVFEKFKIVTYTDPEWYVVSEDKYINFTPLKMRKYFEMLSDTNIPAEAVYRQFYDLNRPIIEGDISRIEKEELKRIIYGQ